MYTGPSPFASSFISPFLNSLLSKLSFYLQLDLCSPFLTLATYLPHFIFDLPNFQTLICLVMYRTVAVKNQMYDVSNCTCYEIA